MHIFQRRLHQSVDGGRVGVGVPGLLSERVDRGVLQGHGHSLLCPRRKLITEAKFVISPLRRGEWKFALRLFRCMMKELSGWIANLQVDVKVASLRDAEMELACLHFLHCLIKTRFSTGRNIERDGPVLFEAADKSAKYCCKGQIQRLHRDRLISVHEAFLFNGKNKHDVSRQIHTSLLHLSPVRGTALAKLSKLTNEPPKLLRGLSFFPSVHNRTRRVKKLAQLQRSVQCSDVSCVHVWCFFSIWPVSLKCFIELNLMHENTATRGN